MVLLRIWSGDDFQKSTSDIERVKNRWFRSPQQRRFLARRVCRKRTLRHLMRDQILGCRETRVTWNAVCPVAYAIQPRLCLRGLEAREISNLRFQSGEVFPTVSALPIYRGTTPPSLPRVCMMYRTARRQVNRDTPLRCSYPSPLRTHPDPQARLLSSNRPQTAK